MRRPFTAQLVQHPSYAKGCSRHTDLPYRGISSMPGLLQEPQRRPCKHQHEPEESGVETGRSYLRTVHEGRLMLLIPHYSGPITVATGTIEPRSAQFNKTAAEAWTYPPSGPASSSVGCCKAANRNPLSRSWLVMRSFRRGESEHPAESYLTR